MDSACFHINYEFLLTRFNFGRLVFISGDNRTLARFCLSCLPWLKSENHFLMKFYFRIFHCRCNRIDCNLKLYQVNGIHLFIKELKRLFRVFVCFFRNANIVISLQSDTFHKFHDSSLFLFSGKYTFGCIDAGQGNHASLVSRGF